MYYLFNISVKKMYALNYHLTVFKGIQQTLLKLDF